MKEFQIKIEAIKIFRTFFFLTYTLFYTGICYGQMEDFTWWDNKHDWDGITHWHEYINVSPGTMGPNALPVPVIKNGLLAKQASFNFALEKHSSSGDQAENIFTELYIPLYSKKVGFRIHGVPAERYRMDTTTRDIRKARDRDGKGYANGDVYFGTYIQLVEAKKYWPDILLTINFKTASGNHLSAARFTDAPGYFFDLSFGKEILFNYSWIQSIRPHSMVGFYVWQTYDDNRRQNDAALYALGLDINTSKFLITNAFGGYDGYLNANDKSFVYRFNLSTKLESILNYGFQFQQGFYDFDYTSFRVSTSIDLHRIKEQLKKNKKS